MQIDTHVHVVSDHRDRYPLDPPEVAVPPGVDPETARVPWFEDRAVNCEDLLKEMDEAGVDGAMLVQAYSAYRYDNRYAVDCAGAHPDRLKAAVIVDVRSEPASAVEHWIGKRGAAAIRLFLQQDSAGWLLAAESEPAWEAVASTGCVVFLALFRQQLGLLPEVLERHHQVRFVLDHCGFPDLSGGPGYPNARELLALSRAPNLYLKLSTQVFKGAEGAGRSAEEVTDMLVDTFGSRRLMWGSDYPASSDGAYRPSVELGRRACAGLREPDRLNVLGATAAGLWWDHPRSE
jgi:L-fuconolactonase